jgi:hypothetical protein
MVMGGHSEDGLRQGGASLDGNEGSLQGGKEVVPKTKELQ